MSYSNYKGILMWEGEPHKEVILSAIDYKPMLYGGKGGFVIRNCYDFDCIDKTEFWHVIKDSFGGMDELSGKMRNQVRRSMRECDFRRMTYREVAEKGYKVYRASGEGYRIKPTIPSEEAFRQATIDNGDKREYWGVFIKNTDVLIAYASNIVLEECAQYILLRADPSYQKQCYPYYGLIYEMNRYYLEEKGLKYVDDGARSVTEHSNIQPFLIEKFNFRKAYCHLNVYYNKWLRIAIFVLYPLRKIIHYRKIQLLLRLEYMARHSKPQKV